MSYLSENTLAAKTIMKTAVVTCHKDEPALLEWIAYHRAIGFDQVFVYDDGSAPDLVRRLHTAARRASWLHAGTAVRTTEKPMQIQTWAAAPVAGFDWVAFLDTDEYLVPLRKSLKDTLAMMPPETAACAVNWRHMGAPDREGRLLIERITQAMPRQHTFNSVCKFLYRPEACRPHYSVHSPNTHAAQVAHDVDGGPPVIKMYSTEHSRHEWFQLNHYRNRDRAWFTQRRIRGDAIGKPVDESEWARYAPLMTERDTTILPYVEQTKAVLAELG